MTNKFFVFILWCEITLMQLAPYFYTCTFSVVLYFCTFSSRTALSTFCPVVAHKQQDRDAVFCPLFLSALSCSLFSSLPSTSVFPLLLLLLCFLPYLSTSPFIWKFPISAVKYHWFSLISHFWRVNFHVLFEFDRTVKIRSVIQIQILTCFKAIFSFQTNCIRFCSKHFRKH